MLELTEKPLEERVDGAENGLKDMELETEEDAAGPGAELVSSDEHRLLESTTPSANTDQPEDSAQNIQSNLTPQDVQRAKKIRVSPFGGFKLIYVLCLFYMHLWCFLLNPPH